ncbi:type I polyketide synthase [Thermosporothrix hazakensis]|nr:type I polyketide synthase [Thermosporothrix hazakensis]GCE51339.1 hypothetical protein KTH_62080 [Thermosporothrix hazakensis]
MSETRHHDDGPKQLTPLQQALLTIRNLRKKLETIEQVRKEPIAIIGMGCRFPGGGNSPEAFWNLLETRQDAIDLIPDTRWNPETFYDADPDTPGKMNTRRGGFLQDIEQFDASFFGLSPREAVHMDPQQRLLLEVAYEACEHAGIDALGLSGSRTGVFVGVHSQSMDYFLMELSNPSQIEAYSSTGTAHNVIAGRLSYFLNLKGPSIAVDTACSSSLVALHLACQSLRTGESDLAFAGGVNLILRPEVSICFSKLHMLAPDGRCKPFDARADGFVRGEGCGVLLLKRLSDAIRDHDPILALIRGSSLNQDGRSAGLTAPNSLSQQQVIAQALAHASLSPAQISYVETHGTGTSLGDLIEIEALAQALGTVGPPCLLGAVKSNIGHLEAAAGIAGCIKVILSMQHELIPANLHFERCNEHIHLQGTRLQIAQEATPWKRGDTPRFAGVSSFGWSGTNAHLILSDYKQENEAPAPPSTVPCILPISARTPEALKDLTFAYRRYLAQTTASFQTICFNAATRRPHFEHRLTLLARGTEESVTVLDAYLRGETPHAIQQSPEAVDIANTSQPVFVFSGHGSQWAGMGRSLLATEPIFKATIETIHNLILQHSGWSLLDVLNTEKLEEDIAVTQPAIFAVQVGLAQLLRSWGIHPGAVIGHSMGEVAAAFVAGALSLEAATQIICERSRLMKCVQGQGSMLMLELAPEEVASFIQGKEAHVSLAAINGPNSVILAGKRDTLAQLQAKAEERHLFSRQVKVDVASHSPQMEGLHQELYHALANLTPTSPTLPFYSTVSGSYSEQEVLDAHYWQRNLRQPVLFWPALQQLLRDGYTCFIELSPHPLLLPAIERGVKTTRYSCQVLPSLRRGEDEQIALLELAAKLYCYGYSLNWRGLLPSTERFVSLPTYPWQRQRYWIQEQPSHPFQPSQEQSGSWESLVQLARRQELQAPLDLNLTSYPARWEFTRRLASAFALQTLHDLGIFTQAGEQYTVEALIQKYQLVPHYAKLLTRWLHYLVDDGLLDYRAPGTFIALRSLPPVDWDQLWSQCAEVFQDEAWFGEYFHRCARYRLAILTGKETPLETLFPQGTFTTADQLYHQWAVARYFNNIIGSVVEALTRSTSRPLRILEIGAGSGGTTRTILPLLPAEKTSYWFTDLSAFFLNTARQRFQDYPFLHYGILDLEQEPAAQGYEPGSFDIIISSNAVHATHDIRQSLAYLFSLLTPGGTLLLYEVTEYLPWFDVSTALIEGWQFHSDDLRSTHPLLSASQWETCLREQGFQSVASFPRPETPTRVLGQHVLLAQKPLEASISHASLAQPEMKEKNIAWLHELQWIPDAASRTESPANLQQTYWVIFADKQGIGQALAAQLARHHARFLYVSPETQANEQHIRLDPTQQAELERLLERVQQESREYTSLYLVHLWSLDLPDPIQDIQELEAAQKVGSGSALHLCKGIATREWNSSVRLWLVTRGAQVITDGSGIPAVAQAPLWGLGRVFAQEYPALWGGLIDLDPAGSPEHMAQLLLQQLHGQKQDIHEDQIAIRGETQYVARLAPLTLQPSRAPHIEPDASYLVTGGAGKLGLHVARWLVSQGARHIILLGRTPFPPVEQWSQIPGESTSGRRIAAIQEMEAQGAQIYLPVVDVAEESQLSSFLKAWRQEQRPPIRGIIHAAAILSSQTITELHLDELLRVMRPKVLGGWLLHKAFQQEDLAFFVLFSSGVSVFGPAGQGNYAAANVFLDTLALYRQALGLPGVSISWGVWTEFGDSSSLSARRYTEYLQGGRNITPEQGLEALSACIANQKALVVAVPFDLASWERYSPTAKNAPLFAALRSSEQETQPSETLQDTLQALHPGERRDYLESFLQQQFAHILRIPAANIQKDTPLTTLGFDSLMTLELRQKLENALNTSISATVIWNYPVISRLAEYIAERLQIQLTTDETSQDEGEEDQSQLLEILKLAQMLPREDAEPEKRSDR